MHKASRMLCHLVQRITFGKKSDLGVGGQDDGGLEEIGRPRGGGGYRSLVVDSSISQALWSCDVGEVHGQLAGELGGIHPVRKAGLTPGGLRFLSSGHDVHHLCPSLEW
jgi:hypothetical protein